jgi:tripartite-type tricarboxylate transporter receptor subunit TctC
MLKRPIQFVALLDQFSMKLVIKLLFLLPIQLAAFSAQAGGTYPDRLVNIVVPFTAGSGSDIVARIIQPKLAERWKQAVVVDNRPGASGNIGADYVAKAAPDGYTLLMAINAITMAPNLYKKPPFDPVNDFTPVMKMAVANFSIVTHPQVPATDLKSLIQLIKSRPGQYNFGSPGNGTPHHLAMELFKLQFGLDMLHVPYKGISGATTDLLGGQVQVMFASVHSMLPYVRAGKLKMLAVTGAQRESILPNVATFKEQGVDVMDAVDAWYAMFAPPKTSPEIVVKLGKDIAAVLAMPDVQEQLAAQGLRVQLSTPEQLAQLVASDSARWKKTITDAHITSD